jgi:hypothetical protein
LPPNRKVCVVVAAPLSVMVSSAVAVGRAVGAGGGAYRTVIVHAPPVAVNMCPDTQVPPVIVKLPGPDSLITVGFAVKVIAVAPEFMTVIAPFFVVPFAVAVVSKGAGPEKFTLGGCATAAAGADGGTDPYSTAPMSIALVLAGSGLWLPKKSVFGASLPVGEEEGMALTAGELAVGA